MEPGTQRPGPDRADPTDPVGTSCAPAPAADTPLVLASVTVQTLEDLAALLRELRRRHARSRRDSSLTYRELAARTGWSQTAIAEYFTARTLPPTDRFDALLEVLCATPAERRALATARDRIEEANRRARRAKTAHPGSAAAAPGQPPVWSAPRQLPAAPRTFTGRTRELAHLDAALDEQSQAGGTMVVSAIGGMGGIGKTWLALHWAHQRLDRFADGQLYADLRGFDPTGQPVTAAAVLRGFLEALGVIPSAIPVELQAQAGLYRSLASGKRMLILLDNARDTAQVTPLLPGGATCTVLITSRRQLTGLIAAHGARSVTLDVLPEDEARQLLAHHLGRARLDAEPDAGAALLACCAGLPLALSIVVARATIRPHQSLTSLAAELSDSTWRLDALDAGEPQADLRAVLSWSSDTLSPAAARAFLLLGIAPGPDITLAAAASLLALPTATARCVLRELDHAHLIQRHTVERYRMHDLLRLHAVEQARDHLTPAEHRAALRRLVDFYVHSAFSGARLLEPDRPAPSLSEPAAGCTPQPPSDAASTMAWFNTEHTSLLTAQQLASDYGWDTQACHLAWALDPYHRRRGHHEDQAATWQVAVTCARQLQDPAIRTQAHQMLGDAYAQLGKTTDALHHLRQALALAEHAGDSVSLGEIHHSLGGTWERHGDDRRALEHARNALLIFRKLDNTFRLARALNGVGWLETRVGDYTSARANCQAALALFREQPSSNRQFGESHTLDSLGYIAHCMHEYDQALDYYQQALDICRTQGHSFLEPYVLEHLGQTHLAQRQPRQARATWQQARDLYTNQGRLTEAQGLQQQLEKIDGTDLPGTTTRYAQNNRAPPDGAPRKISWPFGCRAAWRGGGHRQVIRRHAVATDSSLARSAVPGCC